MMKYKPMLAQNVGDYSRIKEDEEYEKCAIIKGRMDEVNRILRKGNR